MGLQADLAPFFTDMAARLANAHLVIARSGASTVAELMVAGRPGLLVPLPTAADNHQHFNAVAIEDAGAGWVIAQDTFTPELLAKRLEMILAAPQCLSECAAAMRALAMPDAAEKLAALVVPTATQAGV
jgi:UDP-N-acetylglucosamine--N-acetylmuramyl-(pentapeptide) pyrophosphoryl-undecaprenol N-acetylglucosamine transferase